MGQSDVGMRVKSVLFDLDKTLVNLETAVDWRDATQGVARVYLKYRAPADLVNECVRRFPSDPYPLIYRVYEALIQSHGRGAAEQIQFEASGVLEKFEVAGAEKVELIPGSAEALRWLKGRGVKVGVVSLNSPRSVRVALTRHSLDGLVDVISGHDLPDKMKPNPHQIWASLKVLKCAPKTALFVGDSDTDMLAARRAGVRAVGVLTGDNTIEELTTAGAVFIIRNLFELPPLLVEIEDEKR